MSQAESLAKSAATDHSPAGQAPESDAPLRFGPRPRRYRTPNPPGAPPWEVAAERVRPAKSRLRKVLGAGQASVLLIAVVPALALAIALAILPASRLHFIHPAELPVHEQPFASQSGLQLKSEVVETEIASRRAGEADAVDSLHRERTALAETVEVLRREADARQTMLDTLSKQLEARRQTAVLTPAASEPPASSAAASLQSRGPPTSNAARYGAGRQDGHRAYEAGDFNAAGRIWLKLAEAGEPQAQFDLALLYELGQGVPLDRNQAFRWYRRAAEAGVVAAQFNVAVMLDSGQGTGRDVAAAATWYARAAAHGHRRAQFNLGLLYEKGEGVPKDAYRATSWFQKAAIELPAARQRIAAGERSPRR